MPDDDVADRTGRQRRRNRGAAGAQANEQRIRRDRRSRGVPAPQRVVRLGMQRNRPCASALGAADDDLKRGLVATLGRDRGAAALVGLAAAFSDVFEREAGELGASESRAREELEDRPVPDPDRRAQIRPGQQRRELEV
jgi:hypothetical protein